MSTNRANQTWPSDVTQYLTDYFEFSFCDECGKDADEHTLCVGPFGLPFVKCNSTEAESEMEFERRQRG